MIPMTDGLCFCSGAANGFGSARRGFFIPESHTMLVGPQSCGRFASISSFKDGSYRRYSNLFITENELVMGGLEDVVVGAVDSVLECLKERPRVFMIFFACTVSMIGTDKDVIVSHLRESHPEIIFSVQKIDPADSEPYPGSSRYTHIGSLFDRSEQDDFINIIGNDHPIDQTCELFEILKDAGIGVRQLAAMDSFDALCEMGHSRWNLILRESCIPMAKSMEPDTRFSLVPVSYNPRDISKGYASIQSLIGLDCDMPGYEGRCEDALDRARAELEDLSIAIGSSCSYNPLSLTKFLSRIGLHITDVFTASADPWRLRPSERESLLWLKENFPDIQFHEASDASIQRSVTRCGSADLSIGYDAAYYTGSPSYLPMYADEGHFGYDGVIRFMSDLCNSVTRRNIYSDSERRG